MFSKPLKNDSKNIHLIDTAFELYKIMKNISEKNTIQTIQKCNIDNIENLYNMIINPSDDCITKIFDKCKLNNKFYLILKIYTSIENPSDKIKISAINNYDKKDEIYKNIKNPSDELIIEIFKNCKCCKYNYYIIELYESLINPSETVTESAITNYKGHVNKLFKLIKNPSDKIIELTIYRCDNVIELYEMIPNISEENTIQIIRKCNIKNIERLYVTAKNLSDNCISEIFYRCNLKKNYDLILKIFKSIENPSNKIKISAINNYDKNDEIYKSIKNPSEKIILNIFNKCKYYNDYYIIQLYETLFDPSNEIIYSAIDNISYCSIIELYKLIKNPTDKMNNLCIDKINSYDDNDLDDDNYNDNDSDHDSNNL